MIELDGAPLFQRLATITLTTAQHALYNRLPKQYQDFLHGTNGFQLEPEQLVFYTTIPFADPHAVLPSRTDSVQMLLGFSDNPEAYYTLDTFLTEYIDRLPNDVIPFAITNKGLLCFAEGFSNSGAVQYICFFERDREFFSERQATFSSDWLITLAPTFQAFLDQRIDTNKLPELENQPQFEIQQYNATTEQTTRMAMIHNIAMMLNGAEPTVEQQQLMHSIGSQLIEPSYYHQAQAAHPYATLQTAQGAEQPIIEAMITCLMLQDEPDAWQYAVCLNYAQAVGYPIYYAQELISDYRGAQAWKANQPAPSLSELLATGRTESLRLVQLLYLIAVADGGELRPAQDRLIVEHAHNAGLKSEELHYMLNRRHSLELPRPTTSTQAAQWLDELVQVLCIEISQPEPNEYSAARDYCEHIDIPIVELDQRIAAYYGTN